MAKKAVAFKPQPKPKTADDWISAGAERQPQRPAEVMKRFTLDVPASLHKRIKKTCADKGEPMADVLRAILEREFPQ